MMSIDAAACTLRIAREDPAAAEARNMPYAEALKANYTAFGLMKAPNCAEVAVEDILRGHTKGFLLLPFGELPVDEAPVQEILTYLPADWVEALRAGR
ncbi:MAG: hypothetical protein GDA47_04925, partial [Rhodospirillales bacterium]|nr:hypothetical protein [Rhodospirillales bacterium]